MHLDTTNKTFCSLAWDHQFIDPTGRVKPCCRFNENFRPKSHDLNNQTLIEIFYSQWMDSIRQKMLSGKKIDGCERCYEEQAAGKRSLRERYNHDTGLLSVDNLVDLQNPKIKWLELAISNDCNLACRMCDSRYSWKWFKEEKQLFGKTFNQKEHSKADISNIIPLIDDLVHIKFTGGEPLMTPDHWKIINFMLESNKQQQIYLDYATNCTIFPKQEWIDKWKQFKLVTVSLSFDSCNNSDNEYIRYPSNNETIIPVAEKFLELHNEKILFLNLRTTVSLLNVWNLPETLEWWNKRLIVPGSLNPTHLSYPDFLSITVLPPNIKQQILEKFNKFPSSKILDYILGYMFSRDDSHLLPKLKQYLDKTDEYRNQDFFSNYPYYSDVFNSHTNR